MIPTLLPRLFRKANANLLYVTFWPAEKFLKGIFFLSVKFYKRWIHRPHAVQTVMLNDVDKTLTMHVDISKAMGAAFFWIGFHELNEWRFLNKYLARDMTFLDVGANQGEYSLFAAKRLTSGHVIAFEPVDFFFDLLNENIALNTFTNIHTLHYGLSDTGLQVPIYMGQTGKGEHEGLATIFQSDQRSRFIQNIELKVLDDILPDLRLQRIDFMKIDVEGAEMMVLKGAQKTIATFKPLIMMEINNNTYKAAGYGIDDVRAFFSTLDYSLHTITKKGTLKVAGTIPDFCNAVFVPNTIAGIV